MFLSVQDIKQAFDNIEHDCLGRALLNRGASYYEVAIVLRELFENQIQMIIPEGELQAGDKQHLDENGFSSVFKAGRSGKHLRVAVTLDLA